MSEAGVDLLRSGVKNVAAGDGVPQFVLRIGHLEDVGHKLRDAVGTVALARDAPQLNALNYRKSCQKEHHSRCYTDAHSMAASVFTQPVRDGGRARADWLMAQITAQVVSKCRD